MQVCDIMCVILNHFKLVTFVSVADRKKNNVNVCRDNIKAR